MISKDKEIDVLCSLAGFECPTQTGHEQAEGLSFLVGLLRQPRDMPLLFGHEVSQVGRPLISADMSSIDQVIFVNSSPWYGDFSSVFLTDKAFCCLEVVEIHMLLLSGVLESILSWLPSHEKCG
jgi:hypothetical protein